MNEVNWVRRRKGGWAIEVSWSRWFREDVTVEYRSRFCIWYVYPSGHLADMATQTTLDAILKRYEIKRIWAFEDAVTKATEDR